MALSFDPVLPGDRSPGRAGTHLRRRMFTADSTSGSSPRPVERLIYRLTGVNEEREMRWTEYAVAMLLFSVVSMVVLYALQRLQAVSAFQSAELGAIEPSSAFNTACSFTTNTNWQSYVGEVTMSYLTQMAGTCLPQLHFGGGRHCGRDCVHPWHRTARARNDWQLLGRHDARYLMGAASVLTPWRAVLVSQGVVQNLNPYDSTVVTRSRVRR